MKNQLSKLLAIATVAFMASCGGGNSPKSVAEKFLKDVDAKKFDDAKKLATAETGQVIDMMASMAGKATDEKKEEKKITMLDEKIDGDAATVTYKQEGKEGDQTIKLKKVDGKWLVSISKADMGNKDKKEPKPEEHTMDEHPSTDSTIVETPAAPAETK